MKLTVRTTDLQSLMKSLFPRVPSAKATLTVTACEGRLALQSGGSGAATEVEMSRSGEVTLPAKLFRKVLDTYDGTPKLELEAKGLGLSINSFTLPVSSWNPAPKMPIGL